MNRTNEDQEVLHLSREATGNMLMLTSLGFIAGSMVTDTIARHFFRSYKKTLLVGQIVLVMLMSDFLGWAEMVPRSLAAFHSAFLLPVAGLIVSIVLFAFVRDFGQQA